MTPPILLFTAFFVSLLLVAWIHPLIVRIAKNKNITDAPDMRKVHTTPIPVLGGIAVYFGVVAGIGYVSFFIDSSALFVVVIAMMIMLYTGTIDDILNLSPRLRFVIEIITSLIVIFVGHYTLNDFHGLWGIHEISAWVAVPLTVFASVGIINAINLIDGVDGLSSGFCIMSCVMFGVLFYKAGEILMALLAFICVGGLIPFFMHNVFGKRSKMFIGDGGTLVMGIVISIFVVCVLHKDGLCSSYVSESMGLIPFTLAVLSVPVFDTLRVMTTRIMKRKSPFHPDKTHLHHMFIRLGCSHAATALAILILNFFVVLCWWVCYKMGSSVEMQLYLVLLVSVLSTFGLYGFMDWHIRRETRFVHLLHRIGYHTHLNRTGFFFWLRKQIDRM